MQVPLLSDSYLKELVAAFPEDMTVYNLSIDGGLAIAIACCAMQKERYGFWIGGVSARNDLEVQSTFNGKSLSGQNQKASRSWTWASLLRIFLDSNQSLIHTRAVLHCRKRDTLHKTVILHTKS